MPASSLLWGPLTRFGLRFAVAAAAADQAAQAVGSVRPRHAGAGLVAAHSLPRPRAGLEYRHQLRLVPADRRRPGSGLLVGVKVIAIALLWIWLARAPSRLVAASLALIIGGALGNAADRIAWGAVVDFILFHITTPSFTFRWYVFNLADVAIVAGVVGLLYDSFRGSGAAKAP